jgi:hypothetical protein
VKKFNTQPALLTRTQIDWLQDRIHLSKGYQRKIKSDIRRKLRIFNEVELPLLVKSGFITATTNCINVTTNCNMNHSMNTSNPGICAQNIVGRKGFEPSNPAMSRRYLNQARPPARYLRQVLNFCGI